MAGANFSYNPMLTSNDLGGFSTTSEGYVQGVALDDPAIRNALSGGFLAAAETLPMWGGLPIFEDIPAAGSPLGGSIGRALTTPGITGWSVFNQAHNGLTSPQSNVPLIANGMTVNFYRAGSGARIAVPIDPALVSLEGGLITQQVSWDFTNNRIITFNATPGALPVKIIDIAIGNSKIVTYDSVNNFANWTETGSVAIILI